MFFFHLVEIFFLVFKYVHVRLHVFSLTLLNLSFLMVARFFPYCSHFLEFQFNVLYFQFPFLSDGEFSLVFRYVWVILVFMADWLFFQDWFADNTQNAKKKSASGAAMMITVKFDYIKWVDRGNYRKPCIMGGYCLNTRTSASCHPCINMGNHLMGFEGSQDTKLHCSVNF